MAAPTYIAGTVASGLGAVTPAMPAGATTNDLLVLVIESEGTAATPSPPSGGAWTLVGTAASRTDDTAASTRVTVYWALYAAALNRTVPDAGDHTAVSLTCYRDVETGDPINTSTTDSSSTAVTSHSTGGVTTDRADTLILVASTHGSNAAPFANWANASLTDVRLRIGWGHNLGTEGSQVLIVGELPTAGGSGTTTWDSTLSAERATVTLALNPTVGYADAYGDLYSPEVATFTAGLVGSASVTAALNVFGFLATLEGSATVAVTKLTNRASGLTGELEGTATVTAVITTSSINYLSGDLQGTGTVTAASVAVASIQVTALEITGTYTSSGVHSLVADLQGTGTVTAAAPVGSQALTATLSGSATVTSALVAFGQLQAGLTGEAEIVVASPVAPSIQITALEVTGNYTSSGTHNLVADLQGSGTVGVVLGNITAPFDVPLTGTATVTATLYTTQWLTTSLSGTATVTAAFQALRDLSAVLEGTATFAATPLVEYVNQLSAAITGTATVTGSLEVPTVTFVPLMMGI